MMTGLFLSSCRSSDEPSSGLPEGAVYDFVTLEQSSSEGSLFTMRKNGDSPLISYYTETDFSRIQTIKDGDRLILCYDRIGGDVYTSGKIEVYGYAQLSSTDQKMLWADSVEYDDWRCPPMKINALWRTGHYINFDTEISVFQARRPATLVLVADKTSADGNFPELHVYYENAENNDGENPYRVYASFDISEIWNRPECKGVKVTYPAISGPETIHFKKLK